MSKKPKRVAPTQAASPGTTVSRYVSFVMLIVTIGVCGFFFFHVIQGFLLPLFLAALLAVIFRPLHVWAQAKCGQRPALAASLATGAIMLIVLLPICGLVALGVHEANDLLHHRDEILAKTNEIIASAGLEKPFASTIGPIEEELRQLEEVFAYEGSVSLIEAPIHESKTNILEHIVRLRDDSLTVLDLIYHDATLEFDEDKLTVFTQGLRDARYLLPEPLPNPSVSISPADQATVANEAPLPAGGAVAGDLANEDVVEEEFARDWAAEKRALVKLLNRTDDAEKVEFLESLHVFAEKVLQIEATPIPRRRTLSEAQVSYDTFRATLLGGPIRKWIVDLVNPSGQQIDEFIGTVFSGTAAKWLPSITNTATALLTNLMIGLVITAVALFYFFLDGAKMIRTFMQLSPMDDRHEAELIQEFDKVSRAVVLATLLSAVAQGLLGTVGYTIVGLKSIFLLTLLTAVLALIPFVGAAAVWVPCCLWLALVEDPPGYFRAGFLAVYGTAVISMADNVIKPWVLQGQSKLHPLLALLSVLGGVQALGPIGILIGPMVVAFLQVLLTILQREILSMDEAMQAEEKLRS